jgi:hypothetical protein
VTVTATDPAGPEKRGKGRAGAFTGRLRRRGQHEAGEQSVTDAIAAVPERSFPAPRHAATGSRETARFLPAPGAGEAAPSQVPGHAETMPVPLPVTGRPYFDAARPAASPGYGPGNGAPISLQWLDGDEAATREPTALPYTATGWAGVQMGRWIATGEWDDVHAIAEQGLGRNAAAMASGLRRNRSAIATGVRQRLAAIGRPDLAAPLLYRAHELTVAARAAGAQAGAL